MWFYILPLQVSFAYVHENGLWNTLQFRIVKRLKVYILLKFEDKTVFEKRKRIR